MLLKFDGLITNDDICKLILFIGVMKDDYIEAYKEYCVSLTDMVSKLV